MIIPIGKIISFLCLLFSVLAVASCEGAKQNEWCKESRCGRNGPTIKFPFRLKDTRTRPSDEACSYPGFDLFCIGNETALELPVSLPIKYQPFVSKIDYELQRIHLYNRDKCGLEEQYLELFINISASPDSQFIFDEHGGSTLLKCPSSQRPELVSNRKYCQISDSNHYITALPSRSTIDYQLPELTSCSKFWYKPNCMDCEVKGKRCRLKKPGNGDDKTECYTVLSSKPRKGTSKKYLSVTAGAIAGSFGVILAAIAVFHAYTLDKNERENRKRIKIFLEDYKALKPSRFTYADIKKITNHFKDKLGQGAFGTVFKGKLSNDIYVAVKILNDIKENGEEFINEVATMGRIHHVNVVRLLGYCADGFKRALVYEFLPNDSLEKYISIAGGANHSLGWEILQDIAIGVAKGIEYLHQGCDQRILHFDIKPHNVLLDEKFAPKISDFGMAKLCSRDQSIVSMTNARGTMGYIAPEVFSRNFGSVSYKSDVYSFGMVLLEMVGGRKNTNMVEENTEQIYYPEWIYNLLEEGEDLRIRIEEEGDAKIAKKLAIVGLWCIQWHPISRPTMKVVLQMLEGGQELIMPPNPFASSGPSSKTNAKIPARRMALELEGIAE
ncbi:putative receptor-like protein kinase [Morus notabilis]|uniref:Putative receptor-like protein kinase n=1 Tax=Morus notabilis TaxID=981085 RepID=W9S0H6_9ROSA|nr:putative receptor-like protein kinase [Morus notabilis]